MRQLILSRRWIVWHLLTLGAMATCGWMSAWQWQRAGSSMGSALNVGYGLQWPVFAVFFAVMWWRMLQMEVAKLREADAPDTPDVEGVPQPRSPEPPVARASRGSRVRSAEPVPATAPAAPSPFGPRPAGVRVTHEDDPELAAYNKMLAELAARHADD